MNRTMGCCVVLAGAVSLGALGTTKTGFSLVYKAPEAQQVSFKGKKVAALVVSNSRSSRLNGEDVLAKAISGRGALGVTAYSIVPFGEEQDKEKVRVAMAKAGVAAVVVMRVVGKEQQLTSGTASGGVYASEHVYAEFFGGYYNWGWGGVYDPGYLRNDTVVSVETLVYSLETDKLLWACSSETTNPKKVDAFVKNLASKVVEEMKKQGVIQ